MTTETISKIQIGVTIFGMFFGPWLAVKMSLRQFRSTKWWERKTQVYDEIIRSASRLRSHYSECYDNLRRGYDFTEEARNRALAMCREAQTTLETYMYSGGYLITEDAGKSILRIAHCFDNEGEGESEYYARVSDTLIREVELLKSEGLTDLGVSGRLNGVRRFLVP